VVALRVSNDMLLGEGGGGDDGALCLECHASGCLWLWAASCLPPPHSPAPIEDRKKTTPLFLVPLHYCRYKVRNVWSLQRDERWRSECSSALLHSRDNVTDWVQGPSCWFVQNRRIFFRQKRFNYQQKMSAEIEVDACAILKKAHIAGFAIK